jgi:chemotaxis family two-component system response regulator PixG
MQRDLSGSKAAGFTNCWEYQLLNLWIAQRKISLEQATKMICSATIEVLFDITQAIGVIYQIQEENWSFSPLILIDVEEAIAQIQQLWQAWRNARAVNYSPNAAPIIKQPEELQKRTSPQVYQILTQRLDGQHTLRDLAMQMQQEVVNITSSLLPYIQLGFIELINIPDLPAPVSPPISQNLSTPVDLKSPLIACVDDSPLVCKTMEALLTAAGYQFISIEDGLRAFAVLLSRKPDLIFLDLVMPNTNGYEICAQFRKLHYFRNTPILILTGNDGIFDRVRAKLVGASDFLSKPIEASTVLSVIRKHLKLNAMNH